MKKNLFEVAAIWLNGEKKDFQEGIAILKEAGFKPGVVSKLERDGVGGPAAAERLEFQIREFMKAYGFDSNVPDTDPELHVFDGQESPADIPEEKQLGIMAMSRKIEEEEMTVEDVNAVHVIHEYAAAYRRREKAQRLMAEVGELQEAIDAANGWSAYTRSLSVTRLAQRFQLKMSRRLWGCRKQPPRLLPPLQPKTLLPRKAVRLTPPRPPATSKARAAKSWFF